MIDYRDIKNLKYNAREFAMMMSPPILNEPILLFSMDPVKVAGFEICGVNIADIWAIKGAAMGGQKGIGLFPGVELL